MHVSRILGMVLSNNICWELISKWMIVREFIISIIVIVMKIFQFLIIFLTRSRPKIDWFTLTWWPRSALLDSKKNLIKNEFGMADRYFAKPPGTLSGNLNSWLIRSWIFSNVASFHSCPITFEAKVKDLVVGAIPPKDARKSLILPPSSTSKYMAPLTIAISSSARFETSMVFNQLFASSYWLQLLENEPL